MFHVKHRFALFSTLKKLQIFNVPRETSLSIKKKMFHVKHFCLQRNIIIIQYIRAMDAIEPGQDRKVAALRSNFHVHFLFCIK